MDTIQVTGKAANFLKKMEGWRHVAYPDSRGFLTVGCGFRIDDKSAGLSDLEISFILNSRISKIAQYLEHLLPFFADDEAWTDARIAALISMCYQLGSLEEWPRFQLALHQKDWQGAADEMRQSEWARQTPERASLEAKMIETGEFAS